MAEDKNQKGDQKGFAGFQAHLSDVDSMLEESERAETKAETHRPEPKIILIDQKPATSTDTIKSQTPGRRVDKKMLAIVVGVGFIIFVALFGNEKKEEAPAPPPPVPTESNTSGEPANSQQPQTSSPSTYSQSSYVEEIPPIGSDLVLNRAEVTYCLAEKVRMDAMETAIDEYEKSQVDLFNSRVRDYNNRCSSFRYKRGLLESAQADVDAKRLELEEEGRNLLR